MDSMLIPLMESPRLPSYINALQQAMADEITARQRFRDWLTPGMKAEFINGEIVVHSPAKLEHTSAAMSLMTLLNTHVTIKQLGIVLMEKALVELERNDYEPDVCFWHKATSDAFGPKQMVFPPPDWVAEVLSPSTAKRDRGLKADDYAAGGVREYWLVDPDRKIIEQHELVGTAYQLRASWVGDVIIKSFVIEEFSVNLRAIFDRAENVRALRSILA